MHMYEMMGKQIKLTARNEVPSGFSHMVVSIQSGDKINGKTSTVSTSNVKKNETPAVIFLAGEDHLEYHKYEQQVQHPFRFYGFYSSAPLIKTSSWETYIWPPPNPVSSKFLEYIKSS